MRLISLDRIRAKAAAFLSERCTIEAETDDVGEMGEPLHEWIIVAENVPCRVIQAGSSNSDATEIVGSQETMSEMYKIALPPGTPLDIDQRLTVNDVTYEIVRVETALTDSVFAHAWVIRRR